MCAYHEALHERIVYAEHGPKVWRVWQRRQQGEERRHTTAARGWRSCVHKQRLAEQDHLPQMPERLQLTLEWLAHIDVTEHTDRWASRGLESPLTRGREWSTWYAHQLLYA